MSSAAVIVQAQVPLGPSSPASSYASSSVQTYIESDTIFTINDLLLNRAKTVPEVPLVSYPATLNGLTDFVHYTAKNLDNFAEEAAKKYLQLGLIPNDPFDSERAVVALLAPSNIDYVTTVFGLQRLGFSVLLLSNRLSVHAVVSLLNATKCFNIITTTAFSKLIDEAKHNKPELRSFQILEQSDYALLTPSGPRLEIKRANGLAETQKIAFIVHSSGSTGLPKPIFQTHAACLFNYSSSFSLKAFITLPLYHNHGISSFFRAVYSTKEISFFNPNLPLTNSNLATAMEHIRPEIFYGVPYALKVLGESTRGVKVLKECKLVLFGGSSCPDDLGDRLVNAGVNLVGHYGATETGQLMTSFRLPGDMAWNYVRVPPVLEPFLLMDRTSPNSETYEVVVLDKWKSKVASNSDNPPNSFRTRDLFTPHPTIPKAWKYLGRIDDRVTLINGEKVLPIPIEHRIREEPLVKECVVFGIGKAAPGLLLIPSDHAIGLSESEFIDRVWPAIKDANSRAEGFSQISRETVGVLPPDIQYPSTDKGTVIRAAFYKQFEKEIEEIYSRFENATEGDLVLGIEGIENFLMTLFREVGVKLESKTSDFFLAGVDSLRAISVWGKLKKTLNFNGNSSKLSQIVVFEQPNVESLAQYLYALRTGIEIEAADETEISKQLAQKYSHFEKHVPGTIVVDSETVVLTGTTGSLGAHILSQVLPLENVKRVFCLVRASSKDEARSRVIAALKNRNLALSTAELVKICALPSDFSKQDLGVGTELFAEFLQSVTTVIHSAWAVNFNMGVQSFEKQHIQGVHNFLRLCLSVSTAKPARFFFCSSISAAAGTPLPATIRETHINNFAHAQNMGYARSKLVAEHIVRSAAEETSIHARVFRIGQIVGDSKEGIWNDTEAIPLMIRSALTLGALPAIDETPSWLPVDFVARAILELSGISDELPTDSPSTVYHVVNPKLFSWTKELLPALRDARLIFETIPQREWVQRLRQGDQDPVRNPTVKLMSFFAEKYDNDRPGRQGLAFATDITEANSSAIKNAPNLIQRGLIARFVGQWLKRWTLGN